MRLLVDARIGWGHGIGRVFSNTVPRIGRTHSDWQIDVLVPPYNVEQAKAAFAQTANVAVRPCPIAPFSLAEQTSLARYAHGYDLTWFTNYWVPLTWRSPFVVTVHDMLHLMPDLLPASKMRRFLARRTFIKARNDAHTLMFVSRFSRDEFVRLIGAPQRNVVLHLGGDHLEYPAPTPVRERSRRLIVVAASKIHKNFKLLLDAWGYAKIPKHWTLTVVSPEHEKFRSAINIDELVKNHSNIEVRRGISNVELAGIYGDSAILLMPSRYEGFGLPLLEGMLAGNLCLSANAGALIEVAQGAFVQFINGTDRMGWTQAIEQTCALVDRDGPELDPIIAHNRDIGTSFRWEKTADGIAHVLRQAAN